MPIASQSQLGGVMGMRIRMRNCSKCGRRCLTERHHFLPRRVFGKNPFWKDLCPECHVMADAISMMITSREPTEFFFAFYLFMQTDNR